MSTTYNRVPSMGSGEGAAPGSEKKPFTAVSAARAVRAVVRTFYANMKDSFASLKNSPRELYVNFFLNFCDSYSYFALSQILVVYLHNSFGASDLEAGAAYGMWGASITFWGFVMGCFNDRLGIRRALLIGFTISLLSNFILAMTTSKNVFLFVLLCLLPIGNCMGIPMLTVGIKRFTTKANRGFAYGLYYSVMNIAALLSGPVVDFFNIVVPVSSSPDAFWTGNRLVVSPCSEDGDEEDEEVDLFGATPATRLSLGIIRRHASPQPPSLSPMHHDNVEYSALHTESPISSMHKQVLRRSLAAEAADSHSRHNNDDRATRDATVSSTGRPSASTTITTAAAAGAAVAAEGQPPLAHIVGELLCSATFWRFCVFTLFLINLKMIFRHLDATLPTYLLRCFGSNYPKGMIYSINPFMIIWLTPIVAAMTSKWPHYDMIKYGGYFSALSPFFLAMSTSTWAVVMFMVFLSLGEAIWSPRLYDYTMSIAPQGREATFSALAAAPLFAAKIPVGLLSGYLLSHYLPEDDTDISARERSRDGQMLWFIVGLLTISSPILITICEPCIREPERPKPSRRPIETAANASTDVSPLHHRQRDDEQSSSDVEMTRLPPGDL
eukprot:gene11346-8068_t